MGTHRLVRFGRRGYRLLPSEPRCKQCASPFGPPFGAVMRMIGKAPWPKNPKYCEQCYRYLVSHRGGAEIDVELPVRRCSGSTSLAEGMRPAEFRALMDRFFEIAAKVLVRHDAIVDKFVGDEVIGIFVPGFRGQAARRSGHRGRPGPASHDGRARARDPHRRRCPQRDRLRGSGWRGQPRRADGHGRPRNVTARLASAAGAGEMLVTAAAAATAGLGPGGLERRSLALKGKSEATDVFVVTALTPS